jgi:glycosyltransferase involved in cell wall biosynthesis
MKILVLPNWQVKNSIDIDVLNQSSNYLEKNKMYWFFKYWNAENLIVDVIDISSCDLLMKIEKKYLKVYIIQAVKAFSSLRKYDLVVSHGSQSAFMLSVLRLFSFSRYPKHLLIDVGCLNGGSEDFIKIIITKIAQIKISGIITHSTEHIRYYKKYFKRLSKSAIFVPFGIDTDLFDKSKNQSKKEYILSFGYHSRDWSALIDAYRKSNINTKLIIITSELIKNIKDLNISIINAVDINTLRQMIDDAKYVVIPLVKKKYSHGQMSVLQSMAMGKAVITTNIGAINDYVEHGFNAHLYELGDVHDLTKAMCTLEENYEYIKKLETNAYKTVREKYTEEHMSKEIERYVLKVMFEEKSLL